MLGNSSSQASSIKNPLQTGKNDGAESTSSTQYNTPFFSYFYHDLDKEEADYVLPKRKEKTVCNSHQAPVTLFSYPYAEFICHQCYDMLSDKKECYSLADLKEPMERLFAGLIQYLDGGRLPWMERQFQDYKQYFEKVKEDRYKYMTQNEKDLVDRELLLIQYDLQQFWKKIEQMQLEYNNLRKINDYETVILMYEHWAALCYDFKEKYLNFEYVKGLVDRKIDPIMRKIAHRVNVCFMCMSSEAKLTCNNLKDEPCTVCKACASFCSNHGYYCRVHQNYVGERSADKQYLGTSCPLCNFDNNQGLTY